MRRFFFLLTVFFAFFAVSCPSGRSRVAVLWSDRPEFAFYVEYFNSAQDQYIIEMRYVRFPLQRLENSGEAPDIIAGSSLINASSRLHFTPLDRHFREDGLSRASFYSALLDKGNIDGTQFLLPVSFNAPMIIFQQNNNIEISNPFTIGFDEMQRLGADFNRVSAGTHTRMGFSPTWNDNFLFYMATLFNTSFRESAPLEWDIAPLEKAMNFAYEWNLYTNSGIQAVEDFRFRFFNSPPERLVQTGRILFTSMQSNNFFLIAEEQRNNLDFRWLAEEDNIPLAEEALYMGLVRRRGGPSRAAEAFLHWFFLTETHEYILERSFEKRLMETSFGVANGFSALRPVTEQIFPRFYPSLLGHIPPADFFIPANILPADWVEMKDRLVLPFLRDRARQPDSENVIPLERRLADWMRVSR